MIATLGFLAAALAVAPERPNVVLIIADDQAWTDYGFMDHPVVNTPHLDRLAAQGMVFERGYVPSSLCRPSLATIVSGLYPHEHGITGNDPPRGVDREQMLVHIDALETLPDLLAPAGYKSLQTGKWWEGSYRRGGFDLGMTHGDPARGGRHGDEGLKIGRETMKPIFDFVDGSREAGSPFFVWYAPFLPHRPHNPPERLLAKYRTPERSIHVARYYACIEWFDETCGALLDGLEERGLTEDTLVVFVSDNGWIQKEDGPGYAARSKRSPYEGGVRTPIIVRWPERVRAGGSQVPVSSIDIAPTVLAACGVEVPAGLSGQDLGAVARGEVEPRKHVFGATFEHDVVSLDDPARGVTARYVVQGDYKLIQHAETGFHDLYNLKKTPDESVDITVTPDQESGLSFAMGLWWDALPKARPNFLFVLTDDQRADALGCAGHPVLETPNIDRLAESGVRFTNAFVTTSICAASRASLMTGLYEGTHGHTFRAPPIRAQDAQASFPSQLRGAGYRTGFTGKWGVRVAGEGRKGMFDAFRPVGLPYHKAQPDGSTRHASERTADEAVAFLKDCERDEPFCLTVSFNAPHAADSEPRQYFWPSSVDDLYVEAEVAEPVLSEPAFFDSLPAFLREGMNRERWAWRFDEPQKRLDMTRGYWRMISGVDGAVGRILEQLEESGFARNTIVVFTSDNGYFLGERGFAGKWLIYEPSIRVPLVVYDPRAEAEQRGVEVDALALNVDVAPTLLELAGIDAPASYQGRSLVPWLGGEPSSWREDFFYEHRFDHADIPKSEGVRGQRFVYVRYYEQDPVHEELFGLERDPAQAKNLVGDPEYTGTLARMRLRCAELSAALNPPR
ncbi:MAG: sulfatase-like hydrolase/transferase [bacterium]|nr:sulfatase-like hydrolase/transferase [bacterium]